MSGGLYRSENAAAGAPDRVAAPPPVPTPYPHISSDPAAADPAVSDPAVSDPAVSDPAVSDPDGAPPADGGAAANSAIMAIGSLVSRGTGFLRTAALAAALGAGQVGNAYGTALFFPNMIYELLLGGILSSVLVPVLVRRRKSDPDGGQEYAQRLFTLTAIVLGVATIIAVLAAPLLSAFYADGTPQWRDLVTNLARLMLPIMFFSGMFALGGAVLNTRGHFAAPTWTPILNNTVVIGTAGLYIAIFGATRVGVDAMTPGRVLLIGGGALLGIVVQLAGLWPALRKVGFRWRLRFDFRALGLRELSRLGTWMFCYVGVSQIGVVGLLYLLNKASVGDQAAGVAIYNNVYLLLMMAHGIIAVSIITALMPRMSAAAADGRFGDVSADLSRGIRMSTAVLAPVSVVYAVTALPLAVTLFERGAFERVDSERTALVLVVAGIALVPFAISQLFTFAFYAMADTKTPALINIPVVGLRLAVQVGLFVVFSSAFVAAGAMIGNAVSYVAAAVFSAWWLRTRVGRIGLKGISVTFGKVLLAALGAAGLGMLALRVLPGGVDPGNWEAILQLVVGGTVIMASYLGLAVLLRIREIHDVLGLVRRKLRR